MVGRRWLLPWRSPTIVGTGWNMTRRLRKTVPKERLSPSEWEIMRICWRLGRCTVREVLLEDLKNHKRDYRTILTFMTRMARKGWLATTKAGRKNLYAPNVAADRALAEETKRFLVEVVGRDPDRLALVKRELERARARAR